MDKNSGNEVVEELRSVKMLLILQALAIGCQQKHIAAALCVSEATLSRMFPKGFAKEIAKIAGRPEARA
ncbi:putative lipoprotein [Afipia carboxidovorans OM5]|uniref:lipoprotein n=1 Tax=Afipia carboxidovorans TaxID=40137 RepID=UPI00017370DB|nr:lipoprotein [Afipia carboxidovorans]ACI92631.1 putative lipoprotein [Afipia carboxidovorans OM5]